MPAPLAYLLTWTCYGTWLPGDPRGSVDEQNNVYGQEFAPADEARRRACALRLKHAPARLGPRERQIVERAIVDHCAHRGWALHAVTARSNHVHVVITCPVRPDIARDQFKSWATRRLREVGLFPKPMIVWTQDGSSRYLWTSADLHAAMRYVSDGQGPDLR